MAGIINGQFGIQNRSLDLRHDSEITISTNYDLIVAQDLLFTVCQPEGYFPLDRFNMNGVPQGSGVREVTLVQSCSLDLDLIFTPDIKTLSGDLDGRVPGALYVSVYVVLNKLGGRPSSYDVSRYTNYDPTIVSADALVGGNQSTLQYSVGSDRLGLGFVLWKERFVIPPQNYAMFFAAATWWSQWTYDPLHVKATIPSNFMTEFDDTGNGDFNHQIRNSISLLFRCSHYEETVSGSLVYDVPIYGRLTASVRHNYLNMYQMSFAPPPSLLDIQSQEPLVEINQPLLGDAATRRDKRSRDSLEHSDPASNESEKKAKTEEESIKIATIFYFSGVWEA